MTGLWGLVDAAINIFCFRTLGFEFESKSIPFGTYNLMQGLTVFICDVALTLMDDKNWKQLMGCAATVGVLGTISWAVLLGFPFKQKKMEKITDRSKLISKHNGETAKGETVDAVRI